MAQESDQERTEEATPKRLREAREKGNIARSRELNTLVMLLAGAIGLIIFGEKMASGMADIMTQSFQQNKSVYTHSDEMLSFLNSMIMDAFLFTTPFFVLCTIAAFLGPIGLGGWSFSAQAISFGWDKISLISGFKRMFGWQGVMELVKAITKFSIVVVASVFVIEYVLHDLVNLGLTPVKEGLVYAANITTKSFLLISCVLIVVALVDVPFQLWHYNKQLKMSKQEIKDEYKDSEGKPEVKGRIRNLQMQFAKRRMMTEVPKADVIITNPTHFAIALKYDQKRMGAPILIAKGADLVAAEIRRIASKNKIPLLSAPPLARALYYSTDLNQEIPAGLYTAVAKVLAYVYQLKKPGLNQFSNIDFSDLPIPDELKKN